MVFSGTFKPPAFTEEDLVEIEKRVDSEYLYPGVTQVVSTCATVYAKDLCGRLRSELSIDRHSWLGLRDWAREKPAEAKQLKTDLFRLLKAVKVDDGEE